MIETFRKIWKFAGAERPNIGKSAAVNFLNAVFHMFEVSAIYFVIVALTQGEAGNSAAWISLIFMAVSIIGNAVTNSFSKMQQTHAGYFMAANERIKIGNLLKGVPMGYFNENSLGEVTGVCTTVLGNIEMLVPMTLVNIMSGIIGTIVFTIMIIIFEWRVGLIAAMGIVVYFLVVSSMEKKSAAIAPNAQKSQTALTSAVLEYVQGMGVVKSFNLGGRGDKRLQDALEFNRKSSLDVEKLMTPYTILQELVLQIAGIAMMAVSGRCYFFLCRFSCELPAFLESRFYAAFFAMPCRNLRFSTAFLRSAYACSTVLCFIIYALPAAQGTSRNGTQPSPERKRHGPYAT